MEIRLDDVTGPEIVALLEDHLRRGYRHLYLETGACADFVAARTLYARYGFTRRGPFGAYLDDPNSVFMEKAL